MTNIAFSGNTTINIGFLVSLFGAQARTPFAVAVATRDVSIIRAFSSFLLVLTGHRTPCTAEA